jgi:hypothetical protein
LASIFRHFSKSTKTMKSTTVLHFERIWHPKTSHFSIRFPRFFDLSSGTPPRGSPQLLFLVFFATTAQKDSYFVPFRISAGSGIAPAASIFAQKAPKMTSWNQSYSKICFWTTFWHRFAHSAYFWLHICILFGYFWFHFCTCSCTMSSQI